MVSTQNPFPGMNPFLERNWGPVHTALIGFIWETVAGDLPDGLIARPEERLVIDELVSGTGYRADVGDTETWKKGVAPAWEPGPGNGGVVVAPPEIIRVDEDVERWIEIRTEDGRVVTVIELLSLANKGSNFSRYKLKQRDYLRSEASLVEIDLLRGGRLALPLPEDCLKRWPADVCYHICCARAWRPGTRELYKWTLRDRIPAFGIPLRPTDRDIVLDLQPLVDRCYEVGRYYAGRFDTDPDPPLSPGDAAWVDERLRSAGLRG